MLKKSLSPTLKHDFIIFIKLNHSKPYFLFVVPGLVLILAPFLKLFMVAVLSAFPSSFKIVMNGGGHSYQYLQVWLPGLI